MTERKPLLQWSQEEFQRWGSIPRLSLVPVPRTKFLFLKSPLSTVYEEKYGDRNVFTVSMYVQRLIAKSMDVGMVIDCTSLDSQLITSLGSKQDGNDVEKGNNQKDDLNDQSGNYDSNQWYFYNSEEWDDFGIDFQHLGTSNDDSISSDILEKFMSLVQDYWKTYPNRYISLIDARGGHGVAAFLAAYYLCTKWKAPVHTALACIQTALPVKDCDVLGCYDMQLVQFLQDKFCGKQEILMDLNQLPQWYPRSKIMENQSGAIVRIAPYSKRAASDAGLEHVSSKSTKQVKVVDDDDDHVAELLEVQPPASQRYIRALAVLKQLTSNSLLDSIPVKSETVIDSNNTSDLNLNFKVTWKPIGRRGLLLILSDGVFFLENGTGNNEPRINVSMVKCPLYFPNPQKPSELQHRTLLDVTLVVDKEGDQDIPRFYISDILVHMGGLLLSKPLNTRLKFLFEGVITARKKTTAIWKYDKEKIRIRAQEYFDITKAAFVANDVAPAQLHDTKELVFLQNDGEYNSLALVAPLESPGGLSKNLQDYIKNLS